MSKVSEMVERVARDILEAQLRRQYFGHLENIGCVIETDRVWPKFIPEARAAIKAMREPTKEMILAGEEAMEDVKDGGWDSGSDGESHNTYEYIISGGQTTIYQAMNDAALIPPTRVRKGGT